MPLSDEENVMMIKWAAIRGMVELDDGQQVVLVAWRPRKKTGGGHKAVARVMGRSGLVYTVPTGRVKKRLGDEEENE